MKFHCDKCGLCCQNLKRFGDFYKDLDNGNGICIHFNTETKLCKIYKYRPLKCRVIEGKDIYFKNIPLDVYIRKTYEGCNILKKNIK